MNIKNIFVTGGSGKVGRALLPELVKSGYNIRALQFDEDLVTCPGVEIMQGDLGDPGMAPQAVQDIDAVIHLANVKENRDRFMRENVGGTFNLLDACLRCGGIKQFIQAGSDARAGIYYFPRPCPIDETFPHWGYPGYYPLSKILEETLCEQYIRTWQLPVTILRFCWVFDEDDVLAHCTLREPNFGVPVWRELAKTPEQKSYFDNDTDASACMIHEDGKPCIRHVVWIKDVVHGCMCALGNKAALGEAFTIAGPSPFSYDVLANYISAKLDIPVVEFINPEYHDFRHDLSKSKSILGYRPEWDILKIADAAMEFRRSGAERTPTKYIG